MSYAIQIACVIAVFVGAATLGKMDSEQVRVAAVYTLLGVPVVAAYIVGNERQILRRLEAIEKRLDPGRKDGAP